MKQFIAIAAVLITGAASAQTITRKAEFKKGQQIESTSSMKMVMTMEMMGQSMDMVNNYKFTSKVGVTDVTATDNKLNTILTRVVMDMQAGPQTMSYDSDKKEDADSEFGKAFSAKLNTPVNITTDKKGMITASDEKADPASDIMNDMGGGMGESMSKVGTSLEIIANLPEGKTFKTGDTWIDSLTDPKTNAKYVLNYRVVSIQGANATISFGGTVGRSGEMQQGGMTMNMDLTGLLKGEYTMETASGLVKAKKLNMEGEGKLETMGQEIPFKIKIDSDALLNRQ
ncbi:DUF6263 family protein [Pseudobacter ginsenosidimutans]|uniref:YceI-like domain-containing protein n=1 Tax=Pseudobacter ginsenosidimutans TaxID=661488 RepID=A0A4Q7MQI1_9BACT|nr:DUF6263 family protein [Pseudobacter ginsenosidimutans]QEC42177.1 hypothetical protein FSB84_10935 [Pseudobacter ginsenosidimutans]RZS70982.1 hypothetical protein EV199_2881 [Pseudobacter ginsenosidimutans]